MRGQKAGSLAIPVESYGIHDFAPHPYGWFTFLGLRLLFPIGIPP